MACRTDSDIQRDALDELTWDAAVDARNLGVSVAGGVVTITGQVSAYAEKREAERLVEMIPGRQRSHRQHRRDHGRSL